MKFYGQQKILRELPFLENEIKLGNPLNLMLVAPSGWGKTTLALKIINDTVGIDNACISGPPQYMYTYDLPINFEDEIHELKVPENLYPALDSKTTTFILATNELGAVKEPLINRCIPLIFEPYSLEDIARMVDDSLAFFNLERDVILSIAEKTKMNPRVARVLSQRLYHIFRLGILPKNRKELDSLVDDVLDIAPNGLTNQDRRYIDFLRTVGGRASLSLISSSLRIDKATILREIEPGLVYLGLLKISSKGRELA